MASIPSSLPPSPPLSPQTQRASTSPKPSDRDNDISAIVQKTLKVELDPPSPSKEQLLVLCSSWGLQLELNNGCNVTITDYLKLKTKKDDYKFWNQVVNLLEILKGENTSHPAKIASALLDLNEKKGKILFTRTTASNLAQFLQKDVRATISSIANETAQLVRLTGRWEDDSEIKTWLEICQSNGLVIPSGLNNKAEIIIDSNALKTHRKKFDFWDEKFFSLLKKIQQYDPTQASVIASALYQKNAELKHILMTFETTNMLAEFILYNCHSTAQEPLLKIDPQELRNIGSITEYTLNPLVEALHLEKSFSFCAKNGLHLHWVPEGLFIGIESNLHAQHDSLPFWEEVGKILEDVARLDANEAENLRLSLMGLNEDQGFAFIHPGVIDLFSKAIPTAPLAKPLIKQDISQLLELVKDHGLDIQNEKDPKELRITIDPAKLHQVKWNTPFWDTICFPLLQQLSEETASKVVAALYAVEDNFPVGTLLIPSRWKQLQTYRKPHDYFTPIIIGNPNDLPLKYREYTKLSTNGIFEILNKFGKQEIDPKKSRESRIQIMQVTEHVLNNCCYINPKGERVLLAPYKPDITINEAPEILEKYPSQRSENTIILVKNQDTFISAFELEEEGFKVATLNPANRTSPGGGFWAGAGALEETMFRRSAYSKHLDHKIYKGITGKEYDLSYGFCALNRGIQVFRDTEENQSIFLNTPKTVDIIASAAVNLQHPKLKDYEAVVEKIIYNQLFLAAKEGYEALNLTAHGCGAFKNDPKFIAKEYKRVIDTYFPNVFKKIVFAIKEDHNSNQQHNREGNIPPFRAVFENSNKN